MKIRMLLVVALAAIALTPSTVRTQGERYPVELIPPAKGPFTYPPG